MPERDVFITVKEPVEGPLSEIERGPCVLEEFFAVNGISERGQARVRKALAEDGVFRWEDSKGLELKISFLRSGS